MKYKYAIYGFKHTICFLENLETLNGKDFLLSNLKPKENCKLFTPPIAMVQITRPIGDTMPGNNY